MAKLKLGKEGKKSKGEKGDKKSSKIEKKSKKSKAGAKPGVEDDPVQSFSFVRTGNGYHIVGELADGASFSYVEHTIRRVQNRLRTLLKGDE